MRYLFGVLCVCALGLMPLVGCETADNGGIGECQNPDDCDDDNECTLDACTDGMCVNTDEAGTQCSSNGVSGICIGGACTYGRCEGLEDGTPCSSSGEPHGACMQGVCVYEECEGLEDGPRCFLWGGPLGICAEGSCKIPCDDDGQCADDDNECTHDGICNTDNGACDYTPVEDGTLCWHGACIAGWCDWQSIPEQGCIQSGGTVSTALCCQATESFPNTCTTGACGCGPDASHEVYVCICPANTCFDGESCVAQ